jgi:hypothetical protein
MQMSNRLNVTRNQRARREIVAKQKEPKTFIRVRPWLEAKRRPTDGMWTLWAYSDRWSLLDDEDTYRGWVQINVARNVKALLETAPPGYVS